MENLTDFVAKVLGYVVIPVGMIALCILLVAYDSFQWKAVPEGGEPKEVRRVPWGSLGGLSIFLLLLVYVIPSYQAPHISLLSKFAFNLRGAIAGIVIGFVIALVRLFRFHIIMKDLFVLIATPILMIIMYGYFFERSYNDVIISGILGMILGIFLNRIIITEEFEKQVE